MCDFVELMSDALGEQVTPGTHLQDVTGWDSMGVLAVISVVEENFGIVLDAKIQACETISDIQSLINDQRKQQEQD